nr:MAG TPA: hypothetical protein [Inoviridae sp.]
MFPNLFCRLSAFDLPQLTLSETSYLASAAIIAYLVKIFKQ